MAFHLGFELPEPPVLEADETGLTPFEVRIVKSQIRKNSAVIDSYVRRIDLFINQEKYPREEKFIHRLRERMNLLMEENDTFRKLLWRHVQVCVVARRAAGPTKQSQKRDCFGPSGLAMTESF